MISSIHIKYLKIHYLLKEIILAVYAQMITPRNFTYL